jgi:hypothetical protein
MTQNAENPDLGGPGSPEVRDTDEVTTSALGLSPAHADFLTAQAVKLDVALALGVVSIVNQSDAEALGEDYWATNYNRVPYIAFPWTSPSGRVEWQLRPDDPAEDQQKPGKFKKYVYRSKKMGYQPVLWEVRKVENPAKVLIVEGTKQCLSAASYAPDDVAVYGIGGCRQWMSEGLPIPDLAVGEDRHVVILLDADAETNPDVYDAGVKLGGAFMDEGATKVSYAQITGAGEKDGLDDVLGGRAEDKRAAFLARIIDRAADKPAKTRPRARTKKKEPSPPPVAGDGRKTVVVNRDRKEVKDQLTEAMVGMFSGTTLFDHGGVISRLEEGKSGPIMSPMDRGTFNDVSSEAALMVSEDADGGFIPGWADENTLKAVLSRASYFAPLDRLARAPFVRADGSVCSTSGYDADSRTMVALDPAFEGIEVPDEPSPEEIQAARELLVTQMLGDFPFESDSDTANCMALILSPAIRSIVPTMPLAAIDGQRKGVGKGKIASCLSIIHTGRDASLDGLPADEEEMRKKITSLLREGRDLIIFDEAHKLGGTSLARVLTADTWSDRILGGNLNAELLNRSVWLSLGNAVQLDGDLDRRVYRIGITPRYSRPEDRAASSFRHPNLEKWVKDHRRELLTAVLVLVRAWFAAGQPCERELTFQSFTEWERVVGGVLETAGVKGFLDNRREWRQNSDPKQELWDAHLVWLRSTFKDEEFTARDVAFRGRNDIKGYAGPPGLSDAGKEGYAESLGYLYRSHRNSEMFDLVLVKAGKKHGGVNAYTVQSESEVFSPPRGDLSGGDGGDGGDAFPYAQGGNGNSSGSSDGPVTAPPVTRIPVGEEAPSITTIASITSERSPRRPVALDLDCGDCGSGPGVQCPAVPAEPTGELEGLCDSRADALVDARNAWISYIPGDLTDLLFFN